MSNDTYSLLDAKSLPEKPASFFWFFIKKHPVAFLVFFLAPMCIVLDNNVMPYALKMIVDNFNQYDKARADIVSKIAPALWLGGGAWVLLITIVRLQEWWQAYVMPKIQANMRMTVLDYVTQHSYLYFTNQMSGNLANKMNDLPRAFEAIRMILGWNVIATFTTVVVALILLSTINVWFAIVLVIWVIFELLVCLSLAKHVNRFSKENAEDKSTLTGKFVDTLTNINLVKLFSTRLSELEHVSATQISEIKSNKRLYLFMNLYRFTLDIPATAMLVIMVYLLVTFWQKSLITTGDAVFIFYTYFVIMGQMWFLAHSLADLFREIGVVQQALSLIITPIEIKDKPHAKQMRVPDGRIVFDDVSFQYQQAHKLFSNKSIEIGPRQRVGLVGYSGSGKTTFAHLILRFFDVDSGKILIDDQDIQEVTQASLRQNISMIPQDPTLFHRTLYENISYGNPNASWAEVLEASKRAHCHEFIEKLPQGYETLVGERGIKLSGGQRQRVAIARAILKNAPLLILDEATSQLDSVTEGYIQDSLFKLMENKTTLVVAHRLSTLLHMDRILVFDKGQIVEDGSHDELITKNGLYKKMWDAQVGGFLPEIST